MLRVTDFVLRVTRNALRVAGCRLRGEGYGLRVFRLRILDFGLSGIKMINILYYNHEKNEIKYSHKN